MYIFIVEDDPVQFDFIEKSLIEEDEFSNLRIKRAPTEQAFRGMMNDFEKDKPDVILMDVMIRWTDPSPDMPEAPEEVVRDGFYRAGIRCIELLKNNPRTEDIPILVHSVLDKENLEEHLDGFPNVFHIEKTFDPRALARAIRSIVRWPYPGVPTTLNTSRA